MLLASALSLLASTNNRSQAPGPKRPVATQACPLSPAFAEPHLATGAEFDIQIWRQPETIRVRVDAHGAIEHPLLGRIRVKGLSTQTVACLVADRLKLPSANVVLRPVG
jgi:protein involved in polysaccharide export with SLBB domain